LLFYSFLDNNEQEHKQVVFGRYWVVVNNGVWWIS